MNRLAPFSILIALTASANALADSVIVLNDPPRTVGAGSPGGQVVAWVANASGGSGDPGVHYRFATDPSCGAFYLAGFPSVVDGLTDSNGFLTSPAFYGVAPSTSCAWTLTIDTVPQIYEFPMHVFSYAAIVMTPSSPVIAAYSDQGFAVEFALSESGLPLVSQTVGVMTAVVTPNRNGASAVQEGANPYFYDDVIGALFDANSKQGDYSITFTLCCGGPQVTVPVSQRHK